MTQSSQRMAHNEKHSLTKLKKGQTMPTKKSMKRKVQSAKRKVQSHGQNTDRKLSYAQLEAQIEELQKQIALLKANDHGLIPTECDESFLNPSLLPRDASLRDATRNSQLKNNSQLATRNSQPKAGPNPLPAPTLVIMSVSSNSILVDWDKVTNATGYLIEVANDSLFSNSTTLNADAAATSMNIDGLNANTTYYIRVMATGTGANANSGFSNVQSIKTLNDVPGGMDDGMVGDLQTWLDALRGVDEQFFSSLPVFDNVLLSQSERRRALGSGVRRYGYIDKVSDTAEEFPQFWPAYSTDSEKLKERIREIEVLRNLLVYFESGSRAVLDMLLTAGSEAFRLANMYYGSVRSAARQQIPDAEAVFQLLKSFWRKRRRIMDEPTEHEVLRDAKALIHGRKDGMISVSNESDQVIRGKKVLVDETVPAKQHGGVKVVESAEVE